MNAVRRAAAATVLVLAVAVPSQGQICFSPPGAFTVGGGAYAVASGDFNRDGVLDLAAVSSDLNSVQVAIGIGDGSFQSPASFQVGTFPVSLEVSDLDRDGNLDIVVANNNSNDLSVLYGIGNGSVLPAVTLPLPSGAHGVTVADLNNDFAPDLVVAVGIAGVGVLLGTGSRTFGPVTIFPAGPPLFSFGIITRDFNRDGRVDVAVANHVSDVVAVLLGNGSGGLLPPIILSAGVSPFGLTSADFNSDGILDLAIANRGTTSPLGSSNIMIRLGVGDGSFGTPTFFPSGSGSNGIAAADLDFDGYTDLAVANQFDDTLAVLRGSGDGRFGPPIVFAVPPLTVLPEPFGLIVADVNRDGRADVVLADATGSLRIFLSCGASPVGIPTLGVTSLAILGLLIALAGFIWLRGGVRL